MMRMCIGILSLLLVLFLSGCASTQETSEPTTLKQPALEAEQTKEPTRVPAHVDLYPAAQQAESGGQLYNIEMGGDILEDLPKYEKQPRLKQKQRRLQEKWEKYPDPPEYFNPYR